MRKAIPLTHTHTYESTLALLIRPDKKDPNHVLIHSPKFYVATIDQLRHIADTFHDLADHLDQLHNSHTESKENE